MRKIDRAFEDDLFSDGYAGYGARVTVETVDGRELTVEEATAIGSPANPLPESRLQEKFAECASAALDHEQRERIEDAIERLESADSLAELHSALVPEAATDVR